MAILPTTFVRGHVVAALAAGERRPNVEHPTSINLAIEAMLDPDACSAGQRHRFCCCILCARPVLDPQWAKPALLLRT